MDETACPPRVRPSSRNQHPSGALLLVVEEQQWRNAGRTWRPRAGANEGRAPSLAGRHSPGVGSPQDLHCGADARRRGAGRCAQT
jgi:hypothetical protein